jgi:uncharacterized protein (DUF697 family)
MNAQDMKAYSTIKKHAMGAAAAGLLPMPLVDIAAVTGIQLNMLSSLAEQYGVPFQEERGKAIVSSLIAGLATPGLGVALGSWIKLVPVVGQFVGAFAVSIFASAATYAVGKVFIQHFASGGTFLDFDTDKVREHFKAEFEAHAKEAAKDAKVA